MIKKMDWKLLWISLLIPLVLGMGVSLAVGDVGKVYESLQKPSFSPPAMVFPIAWGILYLLMGVSFYLALQKAKEEHIPVRRVLWPYVIQLFLNLLWMPLFFSMQQFLLSFVWLCILIFTIVWMIINFWKISPLAGGLQLPYLAWSLFAAVLNFYIYLNN